MQYEKLKRCKVCRSYSAWLQPDGTCVPCYARDRLLPKEQAQPEAQPKAGNGCAFVSLMLLFLLLVVAVLLVGNTGIPAR